MPRTKAQFEQVREESRQRILQAAFSLFARKGFEGTSIRDVANEAGISTGLLYNYFTDKESMADAILKKSYAAIAQHFETNPDAAPALRLKQMVNQFIGMVEKDAEHLRMLAQMGLSTDRFDSSRRRTFVQYEKNIERLHQCLKDLRIPQAKNEALVLAATLDGIIWQSLLMPGKINVKAIRKQVIAKYL
jgi:AcrR family transcriptional regulator